MMMQTEHTNILAKHVNAKGSVGGRKRSGYHEMMMQAEHTNIPAKHVNAKGSVGGRKRSVYHNNIMMMQTEHKSCCQVFAVRVYYNYTRTVREVCIFIRTPPLGNIVMVMHHLEARLNFAMYT